MGLSVLCIALAFAFPPPKYEIFPGAVLAGGISWSACLATYGKSKGYPLPIGVLCSLLNVLGLIVLLALPDKFMQVTTPPFTSNQQG